MTLLHMESFDIGQVVCESRPIYASASFDQTSTTYGRLGTYGCRFGDWADDWFKTIAITTNDTIIVGFAFYNENYGTTTNKIILQGWDGATSQWVVRFNESDKSIEWNLGTGTGDTYKSAAGVLPINTWSYIEVKVKTNNTTGTVEIRVNGIAVVTASGIDTQSSANAYTSEIQIGGTDGNYLFVWYCDDVYICDGAGTDNNDFLGDCQVKADFPNGNGNSSQMTGSDGNSTDNYLLVDENPNPSTSDYVESSTVGHKDTYAMSDPASTGDTIYGIQATVWAAKDDAGAKSMRNVIRTSSTDYAGSDHSLSTSYGTVLHLWEQNPNTSAAWTVTAVNGLEVGQEVRT